jgi:hypothetical protein
VSDVLVGDVLDLSPQVAAVVHPVRGGLMAKKAGFAGKKAAPFKKGGGRKTSHPNTAKGTPRKKGGK